MLEVLSGTEDCITCYFDDILMVSADMVSHMNHVKLTVLKLAEAHIRIHLKKCNFLKNDALCEAFNFKPGN